MKEIFQGKAFWVILTVLLLAAFVYPPFIAKAPTGGYGQGGGEVIIHRTWEWIFSSPKYSGLIMEIDFKTIVAESIIAILLTIGICVIPFRKIELGFESLYFNPKMVLTKKAFWLMFICVSLAILMFPPFLDEKWGKREWGFIFLPPTHQIVSANIKTDEAQDMNDEFEQYRVKEREKGESHNREMRKMKIDPIILTGELGIGFLLCILATLMICSKPKKGRNRANLQT